MAGQCIILMGVSGTGKSTVGQALAHALGAKFIDGDDLHPRNNIVKMATSQPLNDEDRQPWLTRIADVIFSLEQKNESGVLVCSALKKPGIMTAFCSECASVKATLCQKRYCVASLPPWRRQTPVKAMFWPSILPPTSPVLSLTH